MADFNITVNHDRLPNPLTDAGGGHKRRVTSVLNQISGAKVTDHPGAGRHKRSDDRVG